MYNLCSIRHFIFSHTHLNMFLFVLFLSLFLFQNGVYSRGPCDPLVPQYCTLPFPNSFYTIDSPNTRTGRAVNLSINSTPRDTLERKWDPTEWNTFGGWLGVYTIYVPYTRVYIIYISLTRGCLCIPVKEVSPYEVSNY